MPRRVRPSTYIDDYWLWTEGPATQLGGDPGKWMIFVPIAQIDEYWDRIASAVEDGLLGGQAKVATAKENPHAQSLRVRVVIVYTRDWRDRDDVRRVLRGLRALGVPWRLSYKTDAFTMSGRYGSGSSVYVSQPGSDDFDIRI